MFGLSVKSYLNSDVPSSSTFADYIAFSNSSWSVAPPLPASALPPSPASTSNGGHAAAAFDLATNGSPNDIPFSQNPLGPAVVGLSIASGVLLLALAAALIFGRRRKHARAIVAPRAFDTHGSSEYAYATPYDDSESSHSITKH